MSPLVDPGAVQLSFCCDPQRSLFGRPCTQETLNGLSLSLLSLVPLFLFSQFFTVRVLAEDEDILV